MRSAIGCLLLALAAFAGTPDGYAGTPKEAEAALTVSGTWNDPKLGILKWEARVSVSPDDQTIVGIVDVPGHPEYQGVEVEGTFIDRFVDVAASTNGIQIGTFKGTFSKGQVQGRLRDQTGAEFRGVSSWAFRADPAPEGGER